MKREHREGTSRKKKDRDSIRIDQPHIHTHTHGTTEREGCENLQDKHTSGGTHVDPLLEAYARGGVKKTDKNYDSWQVDVYYKGKKKIFYTSELDKGTRRATALDGTSLRHLTSKMKKK